MPIVTVHAPSRLHFGLMNFGGESERQFGGVGVMVDQPGVELRIAPASSFLALGALKERAAQYAEHWRKHHRFEALPSCQVEVVSAPRHHTGLGVGTQLGMSIAAGLSAFAGLPKQTPLELAVSVGRGNRSAVGIYGFALGGLIAERGKLAGEPVSPLDCHLDLPAAWRFVLVTPRDFSGLASDEEVGAFAALPPVPAAVSAELARLAREEMLPAAARGDFRLFSRAIYEYGRRSGECFAALQGGPYNGPRLTAIVERLRALGVEGVGQSSWGPTVFALVASAQDAERLANALAKESAVEGCDVVLTPPSAAGARLTKCE